MIYVEGDKGTAEVARDYWIRVTTREGTLAKRYPPVWYPWVDPDYHVSPFQHRPHQRQFSAGAPWRGTGRNNRRGQCEDAETGLRCLRIGPQWKCSVFGRYSTRNMGKG